MQKLKPLLATWVMSLGCLMLQPVSASAQALVSNEGANGSVELGNVSDVDAKEPVAAEPAAEVASATPTAERAPAEVPKDPREQYRDKVMKEPEGGPSSATTAASRRYKKVDLATLRATMQNAASQAPTQPVGSAPAQ